MVHNSGTQTRLIGLAIVHLAKVDVANAVPSPEIANEKMGEDIPRWRFSTPLGFLAMATRFLSSVALALYLPFLLSQQRLSFPSPSPSLSATAFAFSVGADAALARLLSLPFPPFGPASRPSDRLLTPLPLISPLTQSKKESPFPNFHPRSAVYIPPPPLISRVHLRLRKETIKNHETCRLNQHACSLTSINGHPSESRSSSPSHCECAQSASE